MFFYILFDYTYLACHITRPYLLYFLTPSLQITSNDHKLLVVSIIPV